MYSQFEWIKISLQVSPGVLLDRTVGWVWVYMILIEGEKSRMRLKYFLNA